MTHFPVILKTCLIPLLHWHPSFCWLNFLNPSRVLPLLILPNITILVQHTIICCLNYCNSLTVDLPTSAHALSTLQSIFSAAPKIILLKHKSDNIIPLFRTLQWIITHRIKVRVLNILFLQAVCVFVCSYGRFIFTVRWYSIVRK